MKQNLSAYIGRHLFTSILFCDVIVNLVDISKKVGEERVERGSGKLTKNLIEVFQTGLQNKYESTNSHFTYFDLI